MIYAAGDDCSSYQFTHAADFMARIVIQNSLFKGRRKSTSLIIPWCTYTSPEIAHVGLYEHQAKEKNIPIDTYVQKLHDVASGGRISKSVPMAAMWFCDCNERGLASGTTHWNWCYLDRDKSYRASKSQGSWRWRRLTSRVTLEVARRFWGTIGVGDGSSAMDNAP